MISGSSSPFIESPDEHHSGGAMTVIKSRELASDREFQISSLQDEKKLLSLQIDSVTSNYEQLLSEKSLQLKKLEKNFDFLYQENQQLQSKLNNQNQINQSTVNDLQDKVAKLTKENSKLLNTVHSLQSSQLDSSKTVKKLQSQCTTANGVNQELSDRINQLNSTVDQLTREKSELVEKLTAQSQKEVHSSSTYNDLHTRNVSLQNINQHLQTKVDRLLQNKTTNELLKQKIISLTNNLNHLSNIEEKYCQLEIDHLKLKSDFDDYFKVIGEVIVSDDSPEIKIRKFVDRYKQLQYESLVYQEKYDEITSQMKLSEANIDELNDNIEHLKEELENAKLQVASKDVSIVKLERQNILRSKEIEFLRNLLKAEISSKEKKDTDSKSIQEYLSNLENLVETYKKEIDQLQKQSNPTQTTSTIPSKRPRSDDKEYSSFSQLQKENFNQASTIEHLQYEIKNLKEKIASYETIANKKAKLQVLQFKLNPVAKDQLIKRDTLNSLKKENEALISKYINNLDREELIPKSIFERQENDKQQLQLEIEQLSKRNKRLRDIYSEKSKQILITISKYFGFGIEFLPNPLNPNDLSSRIKLVSRYMKESNAYLMVDIESKSMKAVGNQEFKSICEELLEKWVKGRDQIPCFLSALTLKVYENNE